MYPTALSDLVVMPLEKHLPNQSPKIPPQFAMFCKTLLAIALVASAAAHPLKRSPLRPLDKSVLALRGGSFVSPEAAGSPSTTDFQRRAHLDPRARGARPTRAYHAPKFSHHRRQLSPPPQPKWARPSSPRMAR